jgi:hypothetical protein
LRIVCHVDVCHQQVVVADARDHPPAFRSAVNGDKLPDAVAAAEARLAALALIFQILRRHAYRGVRIKNVRFADPRGPVHVHVRHQARARADFHFCADDTVGPDHGRFGDARLGIDDRGGMNGHSLR